MLIIFLTQIHHYARCNVLKGLALCAYALVYFA